MKYKSGSSISTVRQSAAAKIIDRESKQTDVHSTPHTSTSNIHHQTHPYTQPELQHKYITDCLTNHLTIQYTTSSSSIALAGTNPFAYFFVFLFATLLKFSHRRHPHLFWPELTRKTVVTASHNFKGCPPPIPCAA